MNLLRSKSLEFRSSGSNEVCDEYGMKKQTVGDIQRSKDKLSSYAMKSDVTPSKDRKGAVHKRKHMKVPKSREL